MGLTSTIIRTDKARLPQSVGASLLFDDSAMILWVKDGRMVINLCLSIEIAESEDEKFFICDTM